MKYSCFLLSLFFCTSIYAHGLRGNACFELFKTGALMGEARPERVLPSLGLREGTNFAGQNDKSIVVVKRKASGVSILLSRFQERWPGIQLFYTTERSEVPAIKALMRQGRHVAYVHIPLAFLANYSLLEGHIVGLNNNLKKIETLLTEPVDFIVTNMTSLGFDLDIEGFQNSPTIAQLSWMLHRQQRHQFGFTFTNHLFEPYFSPNNLGLSVGRRIYLADFLLLSETKNFSAFLAHEIVHSTNEVRFEKYGDVSGRISFFAGESNGLGLFGEEEMPDAYRRSFSTDEMEAWLITERLNPEVEETTGVTYTDFLFNQIEWLTELRRILPGQLIENDKSWIGWVRHVQERTVYAAAPWIHQDNEPYFQFVIFRGAPNEVVIRIPRVQTKIDEMGSQAFLLDAIDRRLRQLSNRARLTEAN